MKTSIHRLAFIMFFSSALIISGCATVIGTDTSFKRWRGNETFQGKGGAFEVIDGVEFWEHGDPDKPYRVIGLITQKKKDGTLNNMLFGDFNEKKIIDIVRSEQGDGVAMLKSNRFASGYNTDTFMSEYGSVRTSVEYSTVSIMAIFQYVSSNSFLKFKIPAEQGDAVAQARLATIYHIGQDVPQNYKEALKWYRKSAEQGQPNAQYILAMMHEKGQGSPQDYKEAIKWARKAAEQGHAGAQKLLAAMYEKGQATPQDYKEAIKWYQKAAEQGDADAQAALATMHLKGQGTPQDYKEAVKWFRKSAIQGNANTQYILGLLYLKNEGVPKDYIQAYLWFNFAAVGGIKSAEEYRDLLTEKMTTAQIAEAQKLARELKPMN